MTTGNAIPFKAIALYSDGTTSDITYQVFWNVVESSKGGSIASNGVYTAPETAGTYHVMAVSATDPSKSATVTITVGPGQ